MKLIREEMPVESAAAHGLIVDCSHGNSGKDEHRQVEVYVISQAVSPKVRKASPAS